MFILIGRLERPPLLSYCAGRAPSARLVVETRHVPLPEAADPGDGDAERVVVHFTGDEAAALFQRLCVGQRLLIHASRAERTGERVHEVIAHRIRILAEEAPRNPAEAVARRRALGAIFLRLRARREQARPQGHP